MEITEKEQLELTLIMKKKKALGFIKIVDNYFGVDTRSLGKKQDTILPRQFAMHYIRKYLKLPFSTIGTFFPSDFGVKKVKDHSSVMYACKTVGNYIDVDKEVIAYDLELSKKCEALVKLSNYDLKNQDLIETIQELLYDCDNRGSIEVHKYILEKNNERT